MTLQPSSRKPKPVAGMSLGDLSRNMVNGQSLVDIARGTRGNLASARSESVRNNGSNMAERNAASNEGRHGDFIGGVENGRGAATGDHCFGGDPERRKPI